MVKSRDSDYSCKSKNNGENIMIRKAMIKDIDQIEQCFAEFVWYQDNHGLGTCTSYPLGVCPTVKTFKTYVLEDALYLMEQDDEIYGFITINRVQPDEYGEIRWKYKAKSNEVLVIDSLYIRPCKFRFGIEEEMVKFIIEEAKQMNFKTIRLHTVKQHNPLISLYTKLGFEIAGTAHVINGGLVHYLKHLFMELNIY